jgi:hypothetical protein
MFLKRLLHEILVPVLHGLFILIFLFDIFKGRRYAVLMFYTEIVIFTLLLVSLKLMM